ncbi:hypothetical protein [Paenibacillus protaetiae]|uniref:Uncharacterized protein n=1 Tax=Paenibacillus protaetiae TaxID=2509456 RepID=A0A4P6FB85_9BACL|nr:hypothetical protein [Paenibacillus protaetiae]QAY67778.1 hypothetical protein ET464_16670 [Paenibacillus protaetiae]
MPMVKRKRKRRRGWLTITIWAASVIIVLGTGGLFAANYAIDRFISSFADQLTVDVNHLDDNGNLTADASGTAGGAGQQQSGQQDTEADAKDGSAAAANGENPSKGSDQEGAKSGSKSVGSGSSSSGKPGDLTVEDAKHIQEEVTTSDKAKVTKLVLKRLSMSDINKLKDLAAGD